MKIAQEVGEKYPRILERAMNYDRKQTWAAGVSSSLSLVEAEEDKVTWKFEVQENHCNQGGNIHGGCVATIIDICSTFAILTTPNLTWTKLGVSTDLTVSYLRGVSAGESIRLVCEVQRVGKSLASMYTKIYDSQGRLSYSGTHTKYNTEAKR